MRACEKIQFVRMRDLDFTSLDRERLAGCFFGHCMAYQKRKCRVLLLAVLVPRKLGMTPSV